MSTQRNGSPRVLIIGAGTAGITVAAQLHKKHKALEISIMDPATQHYYQPAWTLVGGGTYKLEDTARPMKKVMPKYVNWIQKAAAEMDPDAKIVKATDGTEIPFDYLVVAPGLQLNWEALEGLPESIGKHKVCSNYHYDTAPYTWEVLKNFTGGNAIFTQPATVIKCGGAPMKIMFLAEHYFRKHDIRQKSHVHFFTPGSVIFGVEPFKQELEKIVKERNIHAHFFMAPIQIDGPGQRVTFQLRDNAPHDAIDRDTFDPDGSLEAQFIDDRTVSVKYDMLHTPPPQGPPDFVSKSVLAKQEEPHKGWLEVDIHSLQHPRYPFVFASGDVSATPTAKTGAAVRKQAPVLVQNLLQVIQQDKITDAGSYDGYSSCPIVTEYGKMLLAEFDYDSNHTPSLPLDTTTPRYDMWILKKQLLPWMYWNMMLKGRA